MRRPGRRLAIAAAIAALATFWRVGPASAGLRFEEIDFLSVAPAIGVENLHLRLASLEDVLRGGSLAPDRSSTALTLGVAAGLRLGFVSLALLGQRASHVVDERVIVTRKLYADLGFPARWGPCRLTPHLSFGYAFVDGLAGAEDLRGLGAKLGISLQLHPHRLLSIGVRADADLQGYARDGIYATGYGWTIAGSLGLHL